MMKRDLISVGIIRNEFRQRIAHAQFALLLKYHDGCRRKGLRHRPEMKLRSRLVGYAQLIVCHSIALTQQDLAFLSNQNGSAKASDIQIRFDISVDFILKPVAVSR